MIKKKKGKSGTCPQEWNLPMICSLLRRFKKVFEMPTELSPPRAVDHRILIVDGQKPIKCSALQVHLEGTNKEISLENASS